MLKSVAPMLGVLLAFTLSAPAVNAQQAGERERAQIRQLQQQLQKLQQDNGSLRRERDEASAKAGEITKLTQELGTARAGASAIRRELAEAKTQADELRAQLSQAQAELERARAEIRSRDEALASVHATQRRFEVDANVLATRLKQQTARADLCESRHASAWSAGQDLLALYEKDRLRLCEPVTGLWRVREETRIQSLRDRLLDARLELPVTTEPSAK